MEEAQFKISWDGMRYMVAGGGGGGGREGRRGEEEGGGRKKKIWRWKKQIFERKITVAAAQSRDVEKAE